MLTSFTTILVSLVSLLSSFNTSTGFTSFSRYTSSLVLHQRSKTFRLCSVIGVTVVVIHVIKIEIKMNLTRASGSSSDIVIFLFLYFTAWMNKILNLVHQENQKWSHFTFNGKLWKSHVCMRTWASHIDPGAQVTDVISSLVRVRKMVKTFQNWQQTVNRRNLRPKQLI